MPIYPYVCTACGHEFDALQKISDDPLTECPECEEATLRKRLAAPAFQLKGTGWYETDFKNKGKQAAKGNGQAKDQDKGADKKDGGESKSDSKSKSESGGDKSPSSSASKPAAAAKDD